MKKPPRIKMEKPQKNLFKKKKSPNSNWKISNQIPEVVIIKKKRKKERI